MQDLRFELLDFDTSPDVVVKGAALLVREVISENASEFDEFTSEHLEEEIRRLLEETGEYPRQLYAMVDEHDEVIAAADVLHGDNSGTIVYSLAVMKSRRREGIGTRLMKHIAGKAAEVGDEELQLLSLEDKFFERLGFRFDPLESMHVALTTDLLSTEPDA